MSEPTLRVRPGRPSDARALRTIRLQALVDTPDAFGETYEECASWTDEKWSQKAQEWNFYFVEIDRRVVGMARGESHEGRSDTRWLFAMYVTPEARGGESARMLVDTVSAWASSQGVDALFLYVSTSVPRARAFYTKVGFVATGPSMTMHRDESLVCHEMRRDLSDFTFHVHRVDPSILHDLRRRVLRGDDASADVVNPGDQLETSLHYGGFIGERVVVSASFYEVPSPYVPDGLAYQLRYMATDFDIQGRGFGSRLLSQVLDDLRRRGVTRVWANARTSAVDFYRATGWSVVENSFFVSEETNIDHVVIHRPLN